MTMKTQQRSKVVGDHVIVIIREDGKKEVKRIKNIVTTAGDIYNAKRVAGEAVSGDYVFEKLYLFSNDWNAGHPNKSSTSGNITGYITGTEKGNDTGYPKTDDQDTNNAGRGADTVTWKITYGTGSAFTAKAAAVARAGVTDWGTGSTPIYSGFSLGTITKGTNDILIIYLNFRFVGV